MTLVCERCGHESLHKIHAGETCIANLRADLSAVQQALADQAREVRIQQEYLQGLDLARCSTIENHLRERRAGREAELDWARAELKTEQALSARLEREHGNCHAVGAERLATILRMEKDLEAERVRSWNGWEYSVAAEGDFNECYADLQAAEERAARAEAWLRRVGEVVGCPRDDWSEVADATEVVFGSLEKRALVAEAEVTELLRHK